MEEQEESVRKISGKRRRQSLPSIPLDLISEILSKLPAKSVVRFRCVSKVWSSIITNPYFKKSFEPRSRFLLFFKQGDKFFVFSIPQHNLNPKESFSYLTSQPLDSYCITNPRYCSFPNKPDSVHGLICFQNSTNLIIWNPSMREFFTLPKPEKLWKLITIFLGYDPIEGKHKLVCMPYHIACDECRVLTLGSDKKLWRRIKINHKHLPISGNHNTKIYERCIKGVLYYEAELTNINVRVIMSFDVRTEKFQVIELPPWDEVRRMMMVSYEGKLAFVRSIGDNIMIRVLEDTEKSIWSNHSYSSRPHYNLKHVQIMSKLIGMTDDGELIYVPKTLLKSFYITYINPKRKTFRKVEYKGVVDEDFRKRNGLGDKRPCEFKYFPNHIETLSSL